MISEKEFEHIKQYFNKLIFDFNNGSGSIGIVSSNLEKINFEDWYKQWLFDNKKKEKVKKEFVVDENFKIFWQLYPLTNYFTYKGQEFKGSKRALRQGANMEKCQNKYLTICKTIKPENLNNSLKIYLQQAKEKSIFTGSNQLNFMPGIEPYLNQPRYYGLHVGEVFKEKIEKDNGA